MIIINSTLLPVCLDDQTQVDSKPAGQPEHASLNQCQLIAANRCSGHPQLVVEIGFLCNVIDTRALIGPCSNVTSVWSKATPLTARCLSPLPGFESRPGHVRMLPVTWG